MAFLAAGEMMGARGAAMAARGAGAAEGTGTKEIMGKSGGGKDSFDVTKSKFSTQGQGLDSKLKQVGDGAEELSSKKDMFKKYNDLSNMQGGGNTHSSDGPDAKHPISYADKLIDGTMDSLKRYSEQSQYGQIVKAA